MKKFKRTLVLGLIFVLMLVTVACGDNGVSSVEVGSGNSTSEVVTSGMDVGIHTWKIRGTASTAEDVATYSAAMQNGAQIAVDEINMTGGIHGAMIEFIFDDGTLKEEHDSLFVLSTTGSTIDIMVDQTNVYQISITDRNLDATDDATLYLTQMHQMMYGEAPSQLAASAYDGIRILKAAMEDSGVSADMSPAEIRDAIEKVIITKDDSSK